MTTSTSDDYATEPLLGEPASRPASLGTTDSQTATEHYSPPFTTGESTPLLAQEATNNTASSLHGREPKSPFADTSARDYGSGVPWRERGHGVNQQRERRRACSGLATFLVVYTRVILFTLLGILLLILLGSLVFYVAVPYAAQRIMDNTHIQLGAVDLSEMAADGIRLRGQMSVTGPSGSLYAGQMEPATLDVLTLVGGDERGEGSHDSDERHTADSARHVVVGQMEVPGVELTGSGESRIEVDSRLRIVDTDGMAMLVRSMLERNQTLLRVRGQVTLRARGLRFSRIRLDKDIPMDGFGGLNNVTVLHMDLPRNHPDGGIAMSVRVDIYNPSNTTLHLPGLALRAAYQGVHMSDIALGKLKMQHGSNVVQFHGRLLPQQGNRTALAAIGHFVQRYIVGKNTPLAVRGCGIRCDGGNDTKDAIPWLDTALRAYHTCMMLPGAPNTRLISALTQMRLDMDFTNTKHSYQPRASGQVGARLTKLFGFPMRVTQLSMDTDFSLQRSKDDDGLPFARFQVPVTNATTQLDPKGDIVTFGVRRLPIAALPGRERVFEDFIAALTLKPKLQLISNGSANVTVDTAIGPLLLVNLPADFDSVLLGMDSFRGAPLAMSQLSITNTTAKELHVRTRATIFNPTEFGCQLNVMRFVLSYDGIEIGEVVARPAGMQPGNTTLTTYGRIVSSSDEKKQAALSRFFSNYMSGQSQPVRIAGHPNATDAPSALPAFRKLHIDGMMPGVEGALLRQAQVHILWKTAVTVRLFNPVPGVTVTLMRVNTVVSKDGVVLGRSEWSFGEGTSMPPIRLPPGEEVETARLPVSSTSEGVKLLRGYIGRELPVDMNISAYALAGEFPLHVQWLQPNVTMGVRLF
ncbi:hypothetical protein THASP1DRAFT_29922 [Thamnocephalis sphaerospora]|uniref:Pre-rRNA processing protein n=1 Tax=Thamnocephalis sphaerospora TaxID=78915 RepID=A0A4P9XQF5_9FUNG|nr:hypothetical protein THASP1DRAFT_29922 [Thamnocephalis sphaerospora]|eukprot:RKP08266.1 hypothetical protein THASP1DRAFT_29922 [Thamnocephalis sphaerospora]